MKQRDIMLLMDTIAPAIGASIMKALAPALARLEAAENELAELKAAAPASVDIDVGGIVAAAVDKTMAARATPSVEELAALAGAHNELLQRFNELPVPKDGDPGKDADPAVVAGLVKDAVAAVMTPLQAACDAAIADVRAVGDAAASELKEAIAAQPPAPTAAEIAALVPVPEAGKDADPAVVVAEVAKAVAALPPAKDGESPDPEALAETIRIEVVRQMAARPVPLDGKSVTVEDVRPLINEVVLAAVSALPPGQAGKDAEPEAIVAEVARQLAERPVPKDGTSVTLDDVRPLVDETVAKRVAEIPTPKDGVGLAGALLDQDGALVVTLTDGSVIKLGRVIGKAGVDGLGFEDLEIIDGEMTFTVRFTRGDQVKEFVLAKPTLADMHKGVWQSGMHKRGTVVTWGGSQWLAMVDTEAKPETTKDWVLVVKRGRDGKDVTEPKALPVVKAR